MKTLFVAALLGCGAQSAPVAVVTVPSSSASASVIVTPHAAVASQPFLDVGCIAREGAQLDCSRSTLDGASKCLWPLQHVDVTFHPPAYVVECHVRDSEGIRTTGCMFTSNVVLYAATRTGIIRIATKKDLSANFAPVTTASEAIAFARVVTGDDEYTKPSTADDGTPMITRPEREDDAFRLRLFRYQNCSCEHPTTAIDYRVARDGTVTELAKVIALRNVKDDGMCKD